MGVRGWRLLPTLLLLHLTGLSAGFLVSTAPVTTVCGGDPDHRSAPHGMIRSPPLHGHLNCSWVIEASPADRVTINISSLHLPCSIGRLTLWPRGREPRVLCGVAHPASFTFSGGPVLIQLWSGYSLRPAFRLFYSRAPLCDPGHTACPGGSCSRAPRLCPSWSPPPPTPPPPPPGSPAEAACPTLRLLTFFGSFSSPDLGVSPPRAARRCSWLIDPGERRALELRLTLSMGGGDRLWVEETVGSGSGSGSPGPGRPVAEFHGVAGRGGEPDVHTLLLPDGAALVRYVSHGGAEPGGFSAVYQVHGYCSTGLQPCRDSGTPSCFATGQRCNGRWDCEAGGDEAGCPRCPAGQYPCGGRSVQCYPANERCNYRAACPDAADERGCRHCQPGTFHCGDRGVTGGDGGGRCVLESWRCDGQADCADGSDEHGCSLPLPRKVTAAAALGSLVCGLLLVLALGCSCKLYSLRGGPHSLLTPLARMEAAFVQRRAPPSYGQLIADGAIPPVEDFPTENPNDVSMLGNLRAVLQLLRQTPPHPQRRRHRRHRTLRRLARRIRRSRLWALLRPARGGATGAGPETEAELPPPASETPTPGKPGLHPEEPPAAVAVADTDTEQPGDTDNLPLLPITARTDPTPQTT